MRNNRSNNRSRSSRKDAHKKVIVKYLPFLVLIVGILAIIPWEKIFPSPTPPPSPIQEVFFTKGAEPQLATIYLDNSASMQGYAKGIQYLDALADLMSIYPNTEARLMSNSAMVIKKGSDLISKLAKNDINYVGQSLLNRDSSVGYGLWIYFLFHVPYFLILPQMYKSKINNPFFFSHNIIF